jgi:arylsulfatase A-like enzyme
MSCKPNVVLIYTDQQRWDTIAALGNSLVKTPNLDRLCRTGTAFDHAFVNCPVCMPSRMSMLSGRYPAALGIANNGVEMPHDIECVQHILGRSDYRTANIGKLHFLNHAGFGRDHRDSHPVYGFETMINSDEPGCYDDAYIKWVERSDPAAVDLCRADTPPAWMGTPIHEQPRDVPNPYVFKGPEHLTHTAFVAEETCDYIRRHAEDRFFCIAGIYAPHCPINPPQRFVDMYDPEQMPLPRRKDGENFVDRQTGEPVSDMQWRKVKAYYYALVSHIDDQIGRIISTVEELGLRENTLIAFTADHGENLGDHGLVAKGQAYDSSSRVPLVFSMPKTIAEDRVVGDVVEAIDIVPTFLDLVGVQQPREMRGFSLYPAMSVAHAETGRHGSARGAVPRTSAFIELGSEQLGRHYKAVRSKEYLYVVGRDGSEELYLLSSDPHQLANVVDDPAARETLAAARKEALLRTFDAGLERRRTAQY